MNEEITARKVRVIGADGEPVGVVHIDQARQLAYDADLDLVEISPNADPPVCKVMDFGKYQFEQSKKLQIAKKKQNRFKLKKLNLGRVPRKVTIRLSSRV